MRNVHGQSCWIFFRIMSELDLSFEDTEEADAEEEIDPLTLIQESLEDFPPLPVDNEEVLNRKVSNLLGLRGLVIGLKQFLKKFKQQTIHRASTYSPISNC